MSPGNKITQLAKVATFHWKSVHVCGLFVLTELGILKFTPLVRYTIIINYQDFHEIPTEMFLFHVDGTSKNLQGHI